MEHTQRVAVTGGSGFVGRHLTQALRSAGHEVVLISRRKGIDLSNPRQLTDAFRSHALQR